MAFLVCLKASYKILKGAYTMIVRSAIDLCHKMRLKLIVNRVLQVFNLAYHA
jgi:hypothetical protein